MKWSPTRRELLATAGLGLTGGRSIAGGSVGGAPAASLGNVSLDNATDAVPDHPFVPAPEVEWSVDVDGEQPLLRKSETDPVVYVGTSDEVYGFSPDGTQRWRRSIASVDSDRPVEVYPGTGAVYAEGRDGLYALDALDGHTKWRYSGDENASRGHVDVSLVTRETVFLQENGLTAVEALNGRERWRFEPDDPVWFSQHSADGRIYIGTIRGHLYALDLVDGSVRWHADRSDDDAPRLMAVGSNDESIVAWDSEGGELYGFDRGDGSLRWRFAANEDPIGFAGAVRDDAVYLGDGPFVHVISLSDGTERWRYDAGGTVARWPVFSGGTGYFGAVGGVHAVSLADGTRQWQFTTGADAQVYVAAVTDGTVVADSRSDGVYALDADTGRLQWRLGYSGHPRWFPQVVDGTTYFAAESGTVSALSSPSSTPLYDAFRAAVSPPGLALGGLLGTALLAGGYRRRKRAQAPPPDPEEFADFELLEPIAESDHVAVYEARTPAGDPVALKRVESGVIDSDQFADGVETWADLGVPGVLEVREWGIDPAPWVATERWDATLAERVADSSAADLAPREIVHALADAAETVHRAHREEVTHDGLAPETLVFCDGDVRVGDWRLAGALRGASEESDTYRLAVMVEDLLGDDEISAELDEVLTRALAADPADRYDSALDLADALRWAVRRNR